MDEIYRLGWDEARTDVVNYLEAQSEAYFAERGRRREDVMRDNELIDKLASEHEKCVNRFGCEREWSCKDACDSDPGIWEEEVSK